ncbi:MAG: hypothetical protein ACRBK7_01650 [Acidimicrobiales bacterium]
MTGSMTGPMIASLRSELMNVRSTPTAGALLVGSVLMAVASCVANLSLITVDELAEPQSLQLAMHASTVATLVFALVAGLVSSTSDFRFGRIDQLLLSDPSRTRSFLVKAIVGAVTGVVYGVIGALAAVATIRTYFSFRDVPLETLSSDILRPALGVILGAALFAVIGIGVGTAIRNQPVAIAGSLALMLIVEPTALLGLPTVGKWLPGATGLALTNSPDPNLLAQASGGLLLAAWTAIALSVGVYRLRTVDL